MSELMWWSEHGPSETGYRLPLKVKVYKRGLPGLVAGPAAIVHATPCSTGMGWRPGKMWVIAGLTLDKGLSEEEYARQAKAVLDIVKIRLREME